MNEATDKERIIDTVTGLSISTDNGDRPGIKALFVPRVLFGMASLAGRQPVTTMPQAIIDGWDKGLKL
ncbi:MAG TPA: hypothetical protein VL122_13595 [Nitrospirota bacterium]|nr:hypothetical protein [Nitrospirota bacterium]